jgi:hypothetical protein
MASKKFLVDLDLARNSLINAVIQVLASAPSTPVQGQVYFDSVADRPIFRGASAWINLTDRANHTGTQLASTISNFDTQVRTSRLDQMAVPTAALNINSQRLTNVANGTAANDAVNLSQLQAAVNGTDWKSSVRAATTANITLSGLQTVDSISLADGNRVLVKNQSSQPANGIYIVRSGAWERAADAVTGTITEGATLFVEEGTTNANTQWRVQDPVTTVGTDNMIWNQVGGATALTEGTGIDIVGNVISIETAVVARKFTQLIGNGSLTSITVTHNLGNQHVIAQVYGVATLRQVECDIEATSANTTTFIFNVAPTTNEFRVNIYG